MVVLDNGICGYGVGDKDDVVFSNNTNFVVILFVVIFSKTKKSTSLFWNVPSVIKLLKLFH
jgi:hypothetical protein